MNEVKAALAAADGSALGRRSRRRAASRSPASGSTADDVEVRAERHGDVALAQEGPWAVALDLELDDDLRVEGTARELARALNDLRKERGFAIADRVTGDASAPPAAWPPPSTPTGWIAGRGAGHDAGGGRRPTEGAVDVEVDGEPLAVLLAVDGLAG